MVNRIYCFDIDDTICKSIGTDYASAEPISDRVVRINQLFDEGHIIKFYTARGSKSGINWREETEKQLRDWKINYHELHMGKPYADFYIDDKAINEKDFNWKNEV